MSSKTSKFKTLSSPPLALQPLLDYTALFQTLPDRYIVIQANDPEFTFVEVSRAHSEMTGVSRQNIVGRPFFEVFPDVSEKYKRTGVSDIAETFRRVIRTKKPQMFTIFRYDIADNKGNFVEKYWRPAHYPILGKDGKVAFILQSSYDVTEQLSASRQLEETQARLEDALNIGKVGSWLWDIDRDIVVTNRSLADLLEIDTVQAAAGLPLHIFTDAIYHADRPRVLREIDDSVKQHKNFESEYRIESASGQIHWVLARGRLEIEKNGMARFPGVIVDITERHTLETKIEEATLRDELNKRESALLLRRNEELESLTRTKDEFVALASHQLRTPATAVKQYIGMVLQGYVGEVTETQLDMLERAFQSNERQIQIINQILNAARVDTGRLVMTPAPLNIHTQLTGIVEEMRGAVELRGHSFSVHLGTKSIEVYADAGYMRMAIENIIHNAIIYTPSPGSIEVRLKKTAGKVEVMVSNNGVGIKKTDIKKLFTKFTRIHNPLSVEAGGSGIGLYLTAEIVRLHGGSITVSSRLHHGTTFTISLPRTAKVAETVHKTL